MDSFDIKSQLKDTKSETLCRSVSLQSIATISSKSSNDSKDSIFCRICHQNETSDTESPDLISPCKCMGSMANVHQHCLQRWASIASTSSCDICGYAYKCRQKFPTLSQWIKEVVSTKEFTVELVITCLMLTSTPLIIIATILSSLVRYSENSSLKVLIYSLWSITIFSWILYSIMLYFTVRFLCKSFVDWREKNISIELIWNHNNSDDNGSENYI